MPPGMACPEATRELQRRHEHEQRAGHDMQDGRRRMSIELSHQTPVLIDHVLVSRAVTIDSECVGEQTERTRIDWRHVRRLAMGRPADDDSNRACERRYKP